MTRRSRLPAALAGLVVLWAVAFQASGVALFVLVGVGGLAAGLAGVWVRRGADELVELPGLQVTAGQALLAVGVALGHLVLGHLLLAVGAQLLPTLTEAASGVYTRTGGVPLGWRLAVGGLVTGPLEELFWRGALHPIAAQAAARRTARWRGPATGRLSRRWAVPIAVSTLAYAAFHIATLQLALVAAALLGGLVWGWLLERTRSVGATMLAHGLWTSLMVLVPPV